MTNPPLFGTMIQLLSAAHAANVAQLVRALVCGTGGRGFKTHRSPHMKKAQAFAWAFFMSDRSNVIIDQT